jgi:hypothetical protein
MSEKLLSDAGSPRKKLASKSGIVISTPPNFKFYSRGAYHRKLGGMAARAGFLLSPAMPARPAAISWGNGDVGGMLDTGNNCFGGQP